MVGRALVIGGTGPTGPLIVEGLHLRGYDVTILHTGQHEVEFAVPGVKHIHEDPHFRESLERGIGQSVFELVIAQYGRLRTIAEVLAGRTPRLIAIGGATALYAADADERWGAMGKPKLFPETTQLFRRDEGRGGRDKLAFRMVEARDALFLHHPEATYLGFSLNYGPRNPGAYDWTVIRRILDGRRSIIVADGGTKVETRVYSGNAAAAVLLAVDRPEDASGKHYTVADSHSYSMRQRIEFIARYLDRPLELIDMPWEYAWPCYPYWRHVRGDQLAQSVRIREELGYEDAVAVDVGLGETIDWLVANPPKPRGEAERQIGDPFDYRAEEELIARWANARQAMGEVRSSVRPPGHQYRHPRAAGDPWAPASS
jgi:nucleoside-diphosphate-sugar epimerase